MKKVFEDWKFRVATAFILSVGIFSPFVLKLYDKWDTGYWQDWNLEGFYLFVGIYFVIVLPLAYFKRNSP